MKKSMLSSGMLVVTDNDMMGIVIRGTAYGDCIVFNRYNSSLDCIDDSLTNIIAGWKIKEVWSMSEGLTFPLSKERRSLLFLRSSSDLAYVNAFVHVKIDYQDKKFFSGFTPAGYYDFSVVKDIKRALPLFPARFYKDKWHHITIEEFYNVYINKRKQLIRIGCQFITFSEFKEFVKEHKL